MGGVEGKLQRNPVAYLLLVDRSGTLDAPLGQQARERGNGLCNLRGRRR